MESIRKFILKNEQAFKKAITAYEQQNIFDMKGDCYKRSKFPEKPENIRNWLDRKNIFFVHNSTDLELLFSEGLVDNLAAGYKVLEPVYKFLMMADVRRQS